MKKYAIITIALISISNFMCHGASSRLPALTRFFAGKIGILESKSIADYLQRSRDGGESTSSHLINIISLNWERDLREVESIEIIAQKDFGKRVEEVVTRLLPPEAHPCHNLTTTNPAFDFAKQWILDGSLRKEIAKQYNALDLEIQVIQKKVEETEDTFDEVLKKMQGFTKK